MVVGLLGGWPWLVTIGSVVVPVGVVVIKEVVALLQTYLEDLDAFADKRVLTDLLAQ